VHSLYQAKLDIHSQVSIITNLSLFIGEQGDVVRRSGIESRSRRASTSEAARIILLGWRL
jgi:hypothetical protein